MVPEFDTLSEGFRFCQLSGAFRSSSVDSERIVKGSSRRPIGYFSCLDEETTRDLWKRDFEQKGVCLFVVGPSLRLQEVNLRTR